MKKLHIVFMTYKKLGELSRRTIADYMDDAVQITIIDTTLSNLLEALDKAHALGVDVFVAGGAYARIIHSTSKVPVVTIQRSALDYIKAIEKARTFGNRIAIASYEPITEFHLPEFERLFKVKLTNLLFKELYDLDKHLKNSNFDALIGGSVSNEQASKYGIPSVFIYNGKESILGAITEAKRLAEALTEERKKADRFKSIVNFNPSGLMMVDESGIVTLANPVAEKTLGKPAQKIIGQPAATLIDSFPFSDLLENGVTHLEKTLQLHKRQILIKAHVMEKDGIPNGILLTLEKMSAAKTEEESKRLSDMKKGFSAKKNFNDIIGTSDVIRQKIMRAKKYARSDSNILLYGETGVGKELFAQSIHNYSYRYQEPFVAINCAALPENLLESELFGHEEGAFTGSRKGGKIGLFEIASGGTIFLDEIGEIPTQLQSRLLRVLQEKEIIRVGGDSIIPVNVRIITATNKNLENLIPGRFREDLYYRLNVLRIDIPPLRERGSDIVQLFKSFIPKYLKNNTSLTGLKDDYFNILKIYSWPGNIRQLVNIVERFVLEIEETPKPDAKTVSTLLIDCIGEPKLCQSIFAKHKVDPALLPSLEYIPKGLVDDLKQVYPNQTEKIAQLLGMSRTTLWRKTKS